MSYHEWQSDLYALVLLQKLWKNCPHPEKLHTAIWLRERKIECNFPPTKDAISCPDRIMLSLTVAQMGLVAARITSYLLLQCTFNNVSKTVIFGWSKRYNFKTFIWCCKSFCSVQTEKKTLMEIKKAHISYEAKPRELNFVRFVLLVRLCFLFRLKLLLPLALLLPLVDLELLLPL